jgi:uncharacterized membrane protein (DUF4010 family)
MLVVMMIIAFGYYLKAAKEKKFEREESTHNPADLRGAIAFGLIYSAIILAVAAGKDMFGDRGLYVVSIISGLTDVDALTLSTSQLARQNRIEPIVASQLIMIGALSNLGFKAAMAASLGDRRLGKIVFISFAIAIAAGIAITVAWTLIGSQLLPGAAATP